MITPFENTLIVLLFSLVLFSLIIVIILLFDYFKVKERYKVSFIVLMFVFMNVSFFFESIFYSLKILSNLGFSSFDFFVNNELIFVSLIQFSFFFLDILIVYFVLAGNIEFIKRQEQKVRVLSRLKKTKNILLVDTDKKYLSKEKEFLEEDGFSVDVASRGKDALEIIKKKKIDLIVLEWKLSDMNGEEICELIRTHAKTKHIKIILHTYSTLKPVEKRILHTLKVEKYLQKPYNLHELTSQIEHLVF